ncbi:hypothetical protein GCM10022252_24910 [Streptosporangium oxazolinicum]|uniref:Uncharacterized protein n=1 Tax=Streptosporangium oxazolinicum TaxID=909287 RepID=A0ABP8ASD8_9ACTN
MEEGDPGACPDPARPVSRVLPRAACEAAPARVRDLGGPYAGILSDLAREALPRPCPESRPAWTRLGHGSDPAWIRLELGPDPGWIRPGSGPFRHAAGLGS